jgi:hypothetical protein
MYVHTYIHIWDLIVGKAAEHCMCNTRARPRQAMRVASNDVGWRMRHPKGATSFYFLKTAGSTRAATT